MSKTGRALMLMAFAFFAGSLVAGLPAVGEKAVADKGVADKQCDKECKLAKGECTNCPVSKGECSDCPVSKALAALPKITFAVGDERTCCSKSAETLAKKLDKEIQYVVANETYCCPDKAKVALVAETQRFVADFAKPKVCEASGTTTIAGKKVCCDVAAAETAKLVKAAMDKVQLAFVVGDKECHCPVEAKALAEKSGEPTIFVVAQEKTQCKVTAELELARQKYIAAVKELAAAESKQQTEKDS